MTQSFLFPEAEPPEPQQSRRKKVSEILGCASTTNTPAPNEFLPTPWECSVALLRAEGKRIPARVWEPCCGQGDISKELERTGREVISTDLVDRGYGQSGVDFFAVTEPPASAIVTNPPWSLAEKMIRHAAQIGIDYIAFLHTASWLNYAERAAMALKVWCPARAYLLTWRPDFRDQGSPTIDCSWWVFERGSMRSKSWQSSLLLRPVSMDF